MFLNTKNNFRSDLIWVSFLLALITSGCISREEGCLDIAAVNFDLDADRECSSCCQYPALSIVISPKWGEDNINLDSIYFDKLGHPFRFHDLRYMLTNFSWSDENQSNYTVDSVEFFCQPSNLKITPDLILVDTRRFEYALGTIRQFPTIDSISFKWGFPSHFDCVNPSADTTIAILSDESPVWDKELQQRAAMRLILQRDLLNETLDTLFIHTCREISLDADGHLQPGFHGKINLTVDYEKWFMDADMTDTTTISASLETHFLESIFPTP